MWQLQDRLYQKLFELININFVKTKIEFSLVEMTYFKDPYLAKQKAKAPHFGQA